MAEATVPGDSDDHYVCTYVADYRVQHIQNTPIQKQHTRSQVERVRV